MVHDKLNFPNNHEIKTMPYHNIVYTTLIFFTHQHDIIL